MELRGPTLLVFGALLIAAPYAVRQAEDARKASAPAAVGLETVGADQARCSASSFQANTYSFGCEAGRERLSNRDYRAGGALVISGD